jgi:hypothetical protein
MRTGVTLSVSSADLDRLRALISDRNAPQKHVWRAQIVLLTAEGAGTSRFRHRSACPVRRFDQRRLHRLVAQQPIDAFGGEPFLPTPDPGLGLARLVDKLRDMVGLYVDPPAHAVVISVDEKSQIQALDRTQPACR